jgi:hypothetical protein
MTQAPDPQPGHYYVSVIDGGRRGLIAGPWPTHAEALAAVDTVRAIACDVEPRAHFYAFGTARYDKSLTPVAGALNCELVHRLGWSLPVR